MKEKITQYFNQLFEDAPKTRKALDLKREMTQNALDKYEDLVQEGYSEQDAWQNVISSIGDVTELFEELEEKNLLMLPEKDRRKRAMIKSVAVGLYIFAGVVFFAVEGVLSMASGWGRYEGLGLVLAGLICIAPTIMLIYTANMYPEYSKKSEDMDMVEEYKYMKQRSSREKAIMGAISSIIWTLALVLYFLISFTSGAWYITWVIFLIAGCVQSVAVLVVNLRKGSGSSR